MGIRCDGSARPRPPHSRAISTAERRAFPASSAARSRARPITIEATLQRAARATERSAPLSQSRTDTERARRRRALLGVSAACELDYSTIVGLFNAKNAPPCAPVTWIFSWPVVISSRRTTAPPLIVIGVCDLEASTCVGKYIVPLNTAAALLPREFTHGSPLGSSAGDAAGS